jgi:flagellar biosynthetic protein FlhB
LGAAELVFEAREKDIYLYPERLLGLDLQFFADGEGGEKTEEPTTKKLQDARKEGQVARSQELITAGSLLILFVALRIFLTITMNSILQSFRYSFGLISTLAPENVNDIMMSGVMNDTILNTLVAMLPYLLSALVIAIVFNVFQVRWEPTAKPLAPKLNKLSPISGFKRLFSKDKIFDLIKAIAKIVVIGIIAYTTLRDQFGIIFNLPETSLFQGIAQIGDIVIGLGLKISAFYMVLGLVDYIYQRRKFRKDMMMTKQEIKDEYKQTEGDPQIKGQIKQKMREASRRRMMQRIPEADVVITNPTHYACAIKYDREVNQAPVLVAKGADYIAEKIKEVARENFVPIGENKPLARMLYANVELEEEIPPELYQMAADVLAYVYGLKTG